MVKCLFFVLALAVAVQARPKPTFYFTWRDCGNHPLRPLKMHSLSVTPHPVPMPGTAYLSFDVESIRDIANANVELKLEKWLGLTYITIIDKQITDICSLLPEVPGEPITCPMEAKRVTRTNLEIPIPDPGSVGALVDGKYRMRGRFTEPNGLELGCFEVTLTLDNQ